MIGKAKHPKQSDDEQVQEESDVEEVQEQNPLEQENEELKTQLRRALADYQNLQRRVQEDRQGFVKFATEQLLLEMLPVLDNLDQAVSTAPEEEKKSGWFQAVQMTVNQLKDVLKREGMEEINPTGEQFNPHEHEVVEVVEGDDEKVVKVLQKGYKLHGKIARVARVQVGKNS